MKSFEDYSTGRITEHLTIEQSNRGIVVFPSRQLHENETFRQKMDAVRFNFCSKHAELSGQLKYVIENPLKTDFQALEDVIEWATNYISLPHVDIKPGTYGHFHVSVHKFDYIIRCEYGKQSPLKKIGAKWNEAEKGWEYPLHKSDLLLAVLDRATSRSISTADKASKALDTIESLSTKNIKVVRNGSVISLESAYNYSVVLEFRKAKGVWNETKRVWEFKVLNMKSYDALVSAIKSAEWYFTKEKEKWF